VKKTLLALATALLVAGALPRPALAGDTLAQALDAYAKINDYTADIVVHEVQGTDVQDRTYRYFFLRPTFVKTQILDGPGRGGGAVWIGGDQVSGHQGGFLSAIHLKISLHDKRATSLRGDTMDTGTFGAMLGMFKDPKGTVTETDDKTVDGILTDELSLKVADPAALGGITRYDLYIAHATHLPVRRERYVGDQLVKSEKVTNPKPNTGLTQSDFPF
jgi:hypothetical protein